MAGIAFMFPGQGAQEVGMGKDIFRSSPYFRELVELGSDLTHEDLERLCLRGPDKKLRRSFFLQPIMIAVSLGYLRALTDEGIEADVVLGHSLGEITALAAAGVVSGREAIAIAVKRGELMDNAASEVKGSMLAVLSANLESVEELVSEIGQPKRLALANDNAPGQVVVSGETELLEQFSELVSSRRLGRCKKLSVSGPWHTPLLSQAQKSFEDWIKQTAFRSPSRQLILNATGKTETDPDNIRQLISRQLTSPVRWRDCVGTLKEMNLTDILEVGPGRVLSGLVRLNHISDSTRIFNINNLRGLAHFKG